MVVAREAVGLRVKGPVRSVVIDGADELEARSVLIATGVSYRRLEAAGLDELGARGVHYGASASEAAQCEGEEVYLVGAANSAGQAALNLARYAKRVVMLVRGAGLELTMSQYLVARIEAATNIEVRVGCEVAAARGERAPRVADPARPRHRRDGGGRRPRGCSSSSGRCPAPTGWATTSLRDDHGFVVTGPGPAAATRSVVLVGGPAPYALETSVPGVFAAG